MNEENKLINDENISEAENSTKAVEENKENKENKEKKKNKTTKDKKSKKGSFKSFIKSRKAKSGAIAAAIVVVVIAIVIVLNVVVGLLVDRFPDMVLDLTSSKSYALQDDTIDYVSHLDKEISVKVLMTEDTFEEQGTYFVQAHKLLQKMQSYSNNKLKLEYVDLTSNPTFTSKYTNVDWQSTSNNYIVLVECGEQYKVLSLSDCFEYSEDSYYGYSFTGTKIEQAVITAVLNVTTKDKVIVDIITGNQEQDYSGIKNLMENNAYQVNEISLATKGLDKDASIAILYAPSVDLDEAAVTKLSEWLKNDGKYGKSVIFVPTADIPKTPNLDEFLDEWGMSIDKGYVYETNNEKLISANTLFAYIVNYTDYYKDNLKNADIPVVVSDSHSIEIKDEDMAHSLLETSDKAGIMPVDADNNWTIDDGVMGESLVVGAEGVMSNDEESTSRVVVFGSYMMFKSEIMQYNSYNNSAYFMNIINTISGKDDVGITIESSKIENTELGVTDVATQNTMFIVFVVVIPIFILVLGLVVWIRRRNK